MAQLLSVENQIRGNHRSVTQADTSPSVEPSALLRKVVFSYVDRYISPQWTRHVRDYHIEGKTFVNCDDFAYNQVFYDSCLPTLYFMLKIDSYCISFDVNKQSKFENQEMELLQFIK